MYAMFKPANTATVDQKTSAAEATAAAASLPVNQCVAKDQLIKYMIQQAELLSFRDQKSSVEELNQRFHADQKNNPLLLDSRVEGIITSKLFLYYIFDHVISPNATYRSLIAPDICDLVESGWIQNVYTSDLEALFKTQDKLASKYNGYTETMNKALALEDKNFQHLDPKSLLTHLICNKSQREHELVTPIFNLFLKLRRELRQLNREIYACLISLCQTEKVVKRCMEAFNKSLGYEHLGDRTAWLITRLTDSRQYKDQAEFSRLLKSYHENNSSQSVSAATAANPNAAQTAASLPTPKL